MKKLSYIFASVLLLGVFGLPVLSAQDAEPAADEDDSSTRVEQREDSYRRQMELEDARSRDRTYVDNTYSQATELEKIDKLPEESRDNIRDQLVDIIMENGDWEPSDVLAEYPYAPTEAAESDAELMEKEQEAWDEQVEKYHEREAAAFGSHRGPVPGPGNPTGQEAGQQGDGSQGEQGGEQGDGQGGQSGGEGESGSGSAGTYQPYQSSSSGSEDEVSTAGVSESALDFLRGGRAQAQQQSATQQSAAQAQQEAEQAAPDQQTQEQSSGTSPENSEQVAEQAAGQDSEQAGAEEQEQAATEVPLDMRGIIAIKDLDKLEGTEITVGPEDPEQP